MDVLTTLFSSKIFLVVWREAFEALLIVGILYGYLIQSGSRKGLQAMWGGIFAGLGVSAFVAWTLVTMDDWFEGLGQAYFEISVMLIGALLMTHMVFWMRQHGRFLKKNLENDLERALGGVNWVAIGLLCGVAVLREGVETVIFIYGLSFELQGAWEVIAISSGVGFLGALLTFWGIAKGVSFLKQRYIFKFTEIVLLLAASGLMVSAAGKLIAEGLFTPIVAQVWNTEGLISTSGYLGTFLSTWFGYNANPSLLEVMTYCGYWTIVVSLMCWPKWGLAQVWRGQEKPLRP